MLSGELASGEFVFEFALRTRRSISNIPRIKRFSGVLFEDVYESEGFAAQNDGR